MIRGFFWTSKAWYAESALRDTNTSITFGLYDPKDGGTSGEMSMVWVDLSDYGITPRLEAFSDSWKVLKSFGDVLFHLAKIDGKDITEDEFVEILKSCGFRDLTPY